MSDGNAAETRDATGTIVDQTPKGTDTTGSPPNSTPETKAGDPPPKTENQSPLNADGSKKEEPKAEAKPGEKSPLNAEGEKKEEVKTGAPEKYEDFKLPEGVTLQEESLKAATELFKSAGLNQEQAQSLVDFHVKALQEATDGPLKAWQDQQATWKKEVADDPKLGPRIGEIRQNFARMLDAQGDPAMATAFREMMEFTGAGSNPAFIRMMDKISSHFVEGKPLAGGKPAPVAQPGKASGPGAGALWPGLTAS